MEITLNTKYQIRPVPRSKSYLLMAAAGLMLLSGIAGFFLSLMSYLEVSLFVVAGALLTISDVRKGAYIFSTFVLAVAVFAYSYMLEGFLLPMVAATLLFVSAVGLNYNVVPRFMPKRLALPALQIISAVLSLLCIPMVAIELGKSVMTAGISPEMYHLHFIVMLLPFISLLMISLAVEPKYLPTRVVPTHCTKSAPNRSAFFVVASLLVVAMATANLFDIVFHSYNANAFFLALFLLVAGFLFVVSRGRGARFLAANTLLLLSVAATFFSSASYGDVGFFTYSLPILMMFVSAFGFLRNQSPPALSKIFRAPLLNIFAALLLLVNLVLGVFTIIDHVKYNNEIAEARDESIKAFVSAGHTWGSSAEMDEIHEEFEQNTEISTLGAVQTLAARLDVIFNELYQGIAEDDIPVSNPAQLLLEFVSEIEANAEEEMIPLLTMLLCVMPAMTMLLLNLSIGSALVENKRLFARFIELWRKVVGWFYRDSGSKLQKLARVLGVICIVTACLSGVFAAIGLAGYLSHYFFGSPSVPFSSMLHGGVIGILTSFIMALPTLAIHAFGRQSADIREIKEKRSVGEIAGTNNPDELPVL